MTLVTSVVKRANGVPVSGAKVKIALASWGQLPGFDEAASIVGIVKLTTAADGSWSADLTPNASILPTGTHYRVTEDTGPGQRYTYAIIVPSAGPVRARDILATTPTIPNPLVPVGGGGGGGVGPQGPPGPQGPIGPAGPAGQQGLPGKDGKDGRSAYEVAVAAGYVGTQAQWLASLKGDTGPQGPTGATGPAGVAGPAGADGTKGGPGPAGPAGADGTSVKILGNKPTPQDLPPSGNTNGDGWIVAGDLWVWSAGGEWINAGRIQGPAGEQGPPGPAGPTGPTGPEGAASTVPGPQGPAGIPGAQGPDGRSAYEIAVAGGYVGTEAQWLASLVGQQGNPGPAGPQGPTGATGPQGPAGATGASAPANALVALRWDGTAYVAANGAGHYAGPSDPGAVPDGSIWDQTA